MDETADAVVVGAGLNGAATAYFLAQMGFRRVAVLEAELPGSGASGAAVGLLRTHYDNRPETELAAKSMPYFRHWDDRVGGACGWLPTGFFRFVEPHELPKMRRNVSVQREFGERVEILTPSQVFELAPEFRVEDIGAAVYEPDAGTASNSLATLSLLKQACSRGAILEPFTKVQHIEVQLNRVVGVATNRHRIASPIVVLAAGVCSKMLAESCGVALPLEARAIRVAEVLPPDTLRLPGSYMDPISDSWLAPREQGRARISAPLPSVSAANNPHDDSSEFPRAEVAAGLIPVGKRLPGIEEATVVGWWTRPDCYAPDGKPIIGAVAEVGGLFLNTASAGKGHKIAPVAALALSELIADGRARTADIEPFNLQRFSKKPAPWSESEYGKRVIG
jgi:sarcosine oxidase subunit beta